MTEITMNVQGMTCKMCVKHVRQALESLDGIEKADVNLQKTQAIISYDESRASLQGMKDAVKEAGYELLD